MTSCGDDDDDNNNDDERTGSSADFDIRFPDDWDVQSSTSNETLIVGFSPADGLQDTFREFVEVTRTFSPGIDLETFVADTRSSFATSSGFIQLSQREININGRDGQEFIYLINVDGTSLQNISHIYYADETGFVVTGSAISETFNDFREIFDEIMASFEIN